MKHLKEWKVTLYTQDNVQDEAGGWHSAYVSRGAFWACVKPVSLTASYTNTGIYDLADYIVTINKPKGFEVDASVWMIWGDRVLKCVKVEDVEGKTRGDIKLYMHEDTGEDVESFLSKVEP